MPESKRDLDVDRLLQDILNTPNRDVDQIEQLTAQLTARLELRDRRRRGADDEAAGLPDVVPRVQKGSSVLVTPRMQLTLAGVGDATSLALTVEKEILYAVRGGGSDAPRELGETHFGRSFGNVHDAKRFHEFAQAMVTAEDPAPDAASQAWLVLPPLLTRSGRRAVYRHRDCLRIVAHEAGPMIPVLRVTRTLRPDDPCLDLVHQIYRVQTRDPITPRNFKAHFKTLGGAPPALKPPQ